MSKEKTKKASKKQDSIDEFVSLAKELKEIVLTLNQRMSEVESVNNKIKQRLGL